MTALGPMIWGSTYIVTTELLPPDKPFLAAFLRAFPAGLLLIMASRSRPASGEWGKVLLLSFLNIGCFQAMLFVAAYRLPGGLAAVIGAVQPLIIIGLIWGADKAAPGKLTLICCLSSVLGMALLIVSPETVLDPVGVVAALIGAVCMGTGTFLTKRWRSTLPLSSFTGWQLFLGSLMLLPLTLWFDLPLPELTTTYALAYGYLCLFGAVIAYFLWFNGIQKLPPVAVSALGLLSPLSAAALGWLLLGQSLNGISLIGFSIVLVSVFTVQVVTTKQSLKTNI